MVWLFERQKDSTPWGEPVHCVQATNSGIITMFRLRERDSNKPNCVEYTNGSYNPMTNIRVENYFLYDLQIHSLK